MYEEDDWQKKTISQRNKAVWMISNNFWGGPCSLAGEIQHDDRLSVK